MINSLFHYIAILTIINHNQYDILINQAFIANKYSHYLI